MLIKICCMALAAVVSAAYGDPLEVHTTQETYTYGEYLNIIIQVEEISEPVAILTIQDMEGKPSAPIQVPLQGLNTTFPATFPFDLEYPAGQYRIQAEYSGYTAETVFELVETDGIVIPNLIRQVAIYWISGQVSGEVYTDILAELSDQGILTIPDTQLQGTIPAWVMIPTVLWLQDLIDNSTYVNLIQYLVDQGIIIVGA